MRQDLLPVFLLALVFVFGSLSGCSCGDDDDDDGADDDDTDDDTSDDDTGDDDTGSTECVDEDGDGYGVNCEAGDDCNDRDATSHQILIGYVDLDHDGYPGTERGACAGNELPFEYFPDGNDCDDTDAMVHPTAVELPDDGVDQDCVGGDGTASNDNGIFVDGASGSDANPGTKEEPVATIAKGVDLAEAAEGWSVYVAGGSYMEDILVTGTAIFGGYDASDWSRDIDANTTTIEGDTTDPMRVKDNGYLLLDGVELVGLSSGTSAGIFVYSNARADVFRTAIETRGNLIEHYGILVGPDSRLLAVDVSIDLAQTNQLSYGVYSSNALLLRLHRLAVQADGAATDLFGVSATDVAAEIYDSTFDLNPVFGDGYGIFAENSRVTAQNVEISMPQGNRLTAISAVGSKLDARDTRIDLGEAANTSTGFAVQSPLDTFIANATVHVGESGDKAYGIFGNGTLLSDLTVLNSTFVIDDAGGNGYGFYLSTGGMFIADNTFVIGGGQNTVGGFILLSGSESAEAIVANNAFHVWKPADLQQFGFFVTTIGSGALMHLLGNDIHASSPTCLLSADGNCYATIEEANACEWKSCVEASGNIDEDPGFVSNTDVHLMSDSPLIDAGYDLSPLAPPWAVPFIWEDTDRDRRPHGDGYDIGADEFVP
ncbi:putative metal-binding motif-containing protein [bacterium]|nr:putative metal-binding motif-containing protein [bacterium]